MLGGRQADMVGPMLWVRVCILTTFDHVVLVRHRLRSGHVQLQEKLVRALRLPRLPRGHNMVVWNPVRHVLDGGLVTAEQLAKSIETDVTPAYGRSCAGASIAATSIRVE